MFVAGLQPDKTYSSHDIGIKADDRIVSANGVKIDSFAKFVEISRRSKKFDNYVSYSKVNEQIQVLGAANPEIIEKYGKNAIIPEGVNIALPASTC
ncbi:MAG: hypothetical protein MZV70_01590 [Desulfobacterales bacterium]|nr:hypothetical protein [Desulfobacterales bacterium]